MYGFEDPPLELVNLEKKTKWASRPPRLINLALGSLIYSGGEATEPRRRISVTGSKDEIGIG